MNPFSLRRTLYVLFYIFKNLRNSWNSLNEPLTQDTQNFNGVKADKPHFLVSYFSIYHLQARCCSPKNTNSHVSSA